MILSIFLGSPVNHRLGCWLRDWLDGWLAILCNYQRLKQSARTVNDSYGFSKPLSYLGIGIVIRIRII